MREMKRIYVPIFGIVFLLGGCPLTDILSGEDSGPIVDTNAATISGFVWNDECVVPYEFTGEIPDGCIENSFDTPNFGLLIANGVLDIGESGMAGVVVDLGQGTCPSIGYSRAYTDFGGVYGFYNIPAGTYCVSINPLDPENSILLIPGNFSVPGLGIGEETVTVEPGVEVNINFGWDFQQGG